MADAGFIITNVRRGDLADDTLWSVSVKDGRFERFLPAGEELPQTDLTLDAAGKTMFPGLIDLHVHLRDPGFTHKEDILTGTAAAAAGGVTSVFCMPNTKPVCDDAEVLRYIRERAEKGSARVFPVAAITKGLASEAVCDLEALHAAGAAAFSDDGKPVATVELLREAMKLAAAKDYLLMSHCEDMSLAKGGVMNEGEVSKKLGVKGIPNLAEDRIIERDIKAAEETGCRLHICHVSTRGGVEIIRQAKARGVRVTAETCPHYFALTEDDVLRFGTNAKMNPPLRTEDDRRAIIEGLRDGTLDCISTDHAPHAADEKGNDLQSAPNGIIGLETSFAAAYTELVLTGEITLQTLVRLMAENPAKITGLDKLGLGRLAVGSPADFMLASKEDCTVTKESLHGRSTNTPFLGRTFPIRVTDTFVGGEQVYSLVK